MHYHAKNRSKDGVLQMLVDRFSFKKIEETRLHFKDESCNLKLSLATKGVNPYSELRTTYAVWPVFVINNNIMNGCQ